MERLQHLPRYVKARHCASTKLRADQRATRVWPWSWRP